MKTSELFERYMLEIIIRAPADPSPGPYRRSSAYEQIRDFLPTLEGGQLNQVRKFAFSDNEDVIKAEVYFDNLEQIEFAKKQLRRRLRGKPSIGKVTGLVTW